MFTYGFVLLMAGAAYTVLTRLLVLKHDANSLLSQGIKKDLKGNISHSLYFLAISLSFVLTSIAGSIYITVALICLVPD